jgi:hypothetical protein
LKISDFVHQRLAHVRTVTSKRDILSLQELKDNTLQSLELSCKNRCFSSFSLNTDKNIGNEGTTKLAEALKSNTSHFTASFRCHIHCLLFLTHNLKLHRCIIFTYCMRLGNEIGNEGAIKLFEALQLNSSLTSLELSCSKLVASFGPEG